MENDITVLVPIYGDGCGTGEAIRGQGTLTEYCIVGVAAMKLTQLNWAPVVKSIWGFFVEYYAYQPGVVPPGAGAEAPTPEDQFFYLGLIR
jgi:hypothetical protein